MATSEDPLRDWLQQAIATGCDELPAFPSVATRLVALLEHPEAEIAEVETLIAQDAAIAAQVIRSANSALYGGAVEVDSLAAATLRLGFKETANVAMAAAWRSLYDIEERAEYEVFAPHWKALWLDSLVCAFGARQLSRELKLGDDERVFLGALFRDAGSLLILKLLARGLVQGRLRDRPSEAELAELVASQHAPLGAAYLRDAQLPDYVVDAAAAHHQLGLPFEPTSLELHLIRVANGFSEALGLTAFAPAEMGPAAAQSLELLELRPEQREHFEAVFAALVDRVRDLL